MSAKPIRVLIVDDEQQIRDSMTFFLKDMEYEVYTAGSVKETFSILEKVELHLIIADLNLPDGYGENLIEDIAELENKIKLILDSE